MPTLERIQKSKRIKFILILSTIILIVMMFPKGVSLESEVTINSIWIQDDLIASTSFEILKEPIQYEREKAASAEKVSPIFVKNDIEKQVIDSLKNYTQKLTSIIDADIYLNRPADKSQIFLSEDSYQFFKNIRRQENLLSSESRITIGSIVRICEDIISRIYRRGFIDLQYDEIDKDSVSVREGKYQKIIPKVTFYDPQSVISLIDSRLTRQYGENTALLVAVKEYLTYFLIPDIGYSGSLTTEAKNLAVSKVSSNKGIVNENERIVAKHDKITQEIKEKIDSYRKAKGFESGFWERFLQNLGKFFHVLVILTLFFIYIYLFRKRIYEDNFKILLMAIIILLISFIAFIVTQLAVSGPVELLILVPVASMLLTIIFDSRVGFYATVVCALIVGALRGNDYVITVMNIVSGGLAAYTVRDIKNRNQIFRSFLFIFSGYVISIVAFGLERFEAVQQILIHSAYAASNSILSPALTFGLIIFFEKIFRITTELTLLELSDFDTPLLRELARNTPGTFNHSMIIGTMVESAAGVIGANPILARVGAYYHDIGKLSNPDGFVENQLANTNIHESLEPIKSAQMIIEHVNKGIELAKEYKLPKEITDFIPMHHGTMVVTFFYEKAKEKFGADKISKDDYRYPGPKPNTKETALLMLADACESAVRSMSDPDPQKIENVINNLVKIRVEDGQLNEAPITLRDLEKIKDEYLKVLISQHHKRIRYPKQDELENKSEKN